MNVRWPTHLRWIAALAIAVCVPATAQAVTTYELDAGSISLTVDEYAPGDGIYRAADSVTVDIDSMTLAIDTDTGAIVSLDILVTTPVELTLRDGSPAYEEDEFRTLVLEAFEVHASSGLLLENGGYSFGDDIFVSATFGAMDANGEMLLQSRSADPMVDGDLSDGPIFGDLLNDELISLIGMALGFFDSPLNENYLVVSGDFSFSARTNLAAPMPEPGAMPLFGMGLFLAGVAARRRGRGIPEGRRER